MPPRGRKKKKQLNEWLGDTPEVQALGAGLRALRLHNAGYTEAQDEGNIITARSLAAKSDERNAKTAFMLPEPGARGGHFVKGSTAKEVISALGLPNISTLNREFNAGKFVEDSKMKNFHRANVRGVPVMRSFHYPEVSLLDLLTHVD